MFFCFLADRIARSAGAFDKEVSDNLQLALLDYQFDLQQAEMAVQTFTMPSYPPSKGDVDRVQKPFDPVTRIRFKGSPTYLTERKDGSNKYHVFQMTNRGGFNGYGRIGHTMTLFGPMSPQQYQSKLKSKMKKGYRETGF